MGMNPVCKVLASLTLFLLIVYHTNHDNGRCHAAPSPLTDPKRDGYSRLTRDIKNHPIVKDKVPPGISQSYGEAVVNDDRHQEGDFDHEAVNVTIQLMPIDILSLDPAHQVLEMSAYIRLSWWDTNLAWNASDYGGVKMIEMSSSDMWTPTISVLNGVENNDLIVDDSIPLCLENTGIVSFTFSVRLKTSCALDLTMFPFDKQTCYITILGTSILNVNILPSDFTTLLLQNFSAGGEWLLSDITLEAVPGLNHNKINKITTMTVQLQRKMLFYVVSVVIPMALFTVMNCLVFLIPPESGEKVSFVVSIFISNAVFTSFVGGLMPRSLDGITMIPLLMAYLIFMWLWGVLTFIATAVVINKFHAEQADQDHRTQQETDIDRNRGGRRESNLTKSRESAPAGSVLTKFKMSVFATRGTVAACEDSRRTPVTDLVRSPGQPGLNLTAVTIPSRSEANDDCRLRPSKKKAPPRITAKSLDWIFLILSLLITVVVHLVLVVLYYVYSMS